MVTLLPPHHHQTVSSASTETHSDVILIYSPQFCHLADQRVAAASSSSPFASGRGWKPDEGKQEEVGGATASLVST